jgi:hypothetical protein
MALGMQARQGLRCLYRETGHSVHGMKGTCRESRVGVYGGSLTRPGHCSAVECSGRDGPLESHVASRRHADSPSSRQLLRFVLMSPLFLTPSHALRRLSAEVVSERRVGSCQWETGRVRPA